MPRSCGRRDLRRKLGLAIHSIIIGRFLAGCSSGPRGAGYLDREYPSLCAAFEAAAQFALSVHVQKTKTDFEALRSQTNVALARELKVEASTRNRIDCQDLAETGKGLNETTLYRSALASFVSLLDPHSSYLPPAKLESYEKWKKNDESGLGVIWKAQMVDQWLPIHALQIDYVIL